MINSPTSWSPIDLERHRPPGQHLRGPIWMDKKRNKGSKEGVNHTYKPKDKENLWKMSNIQQVLKCSSRYSIQFDTSVID
jgi:hypothetical protein